MHCWDLLRWGALPARSILQNCQVSHHHFCEFLSGFGGCYKLHLRELHLVHGLTVEEFGLFGSEEDVIKILMNGLRFHSGTLKIWIYQNLHSSHFQDEAASPLSNGFDVQLLFQLTEALVIWRSTEPASLWTSWLHRLHLFWFWETHGAFKGLRLRARSPWSKAVETIVTISRAEGVSGPEEKTRTKHQNAATWTRFHGCGSATFTARLIYLILKCYRKCSVINVLSMQNEYFAQWMHAGMLHFAVGSESSPYASCQDLLDTPGVSGLRPRKGDASTKRWQLLSETCKRQG